MALQTGKIHSGGTGRYYEGGTRYYSSNDHHDSDGDGNPNPEDSGEERANDRRIQPLLTKHPILRAKNRSNDLSESYSSDDEESAGKTGSGSGSDDDQLQSEEESPSESEEEEDLKDISFGALAKAQASFDPSSRKRKRDIEDETSVAKPRGEEDDGRRAAEELKKRVKEPRVDAQKRTSKHAPTVESARKPVSRKRVVFEPSPALKSRDPRFDPTVMSGNPDRHAASNANKNYAFLTSYQVQEILDLKSQIKKSKDPEAVAQLKRQVMSIEAKVRNSEAQQQENEIRKKHKEKEREALRAGEKAKPYYLKDADVRKLAKQERLDSMSKNARDKAEKRRQKREKGKDSRDMPRVRRG